MTPSKPDIHLRDYLRIVFKHIWVVLLFMIVVGVTAWLSQRNQQVAYRSVGRLELRGETPPNVPVADLFAYRVTRHKDFNTMIELIRSRSLSERVVGRLDPKEVELLGSNPTAAALSLRQRLNIGMVKNTNLVDVSLEGRDGRLTTTIVNAVLSEFVDFNRDRLKSHADRVRDRLLSERPRLIKRVERAQRKQKKFKEDPKHRHLSFGEMDDHRIPVIKIERITLALAGIEVRQNELLPKVEKLRKVSSREELLGLRMIAREPRINKLEIEFNYLKEQEIGLRAKGFIKHTNLTGVRKRISENRAEFERVLSSIVSGYEEELVLLSEQHRNLSMALEREKKKKEEIQKIYSKYRDISSQLAEQTAKLREVDDYIKKSRQQSDLRLNNVSIVDRAVVPHTPTSGGKGVNYLFAMLIGVAGGIGLAFFFEYLDDTVKTQEDVETYMKVPLLGFVPFIKGEKDHPEAKDTITHREPKSSISEAFRSIRTGLIFSASRSGVENKLGKCVSLVVTSAGPREGKTTNAVNLAITLAHSGSRVVLIDADLRRPRIHKSFQTTSERGLTNYLAGASDFESIQRETDVKNLYAIVSGPLPPNPYEMLGSARMEEFLAEATKSCDFLIFDTPPLIAVSDACILARKVDGVVQVVSAGRTRRKLVQMGKEQIENVGGVLAGVILNNVAPARADYYYYYYYYPGYYRYYHRYYQEGPDES